MEERAAVLTSCSSQAESDNSCLTLSVFFMWCVCACVYAIDMCVHRVLHTHQMVVCLHVLGCIEYLFDLCHGLRLITSADRWL